MKNRKYKKRLLSYIRRRSDGREFQVFKNVKNPQSYLVWRVGGHTEIVSYYKLRKYYV